MKRQKLIEFFLLSGLLMFFANCGYEIISEYWWVQIVFFVIAMIMILIAWALMPEDKEDEDDEFEMPRRISDFELCYLEAIKENRMTTQDVIKIINNTEE